jgi:sensitive to high expression protein 9
MDNLQSRAVMATQTLNDLTGYSAIEAIKKRNSELESLLSTAQHRLREARHNYKALTSHRAATQREVTTLLARKDTWNPADLERFTTLYRLDHELEAQVGSAAAELTDAETDEAKLSSELNAGILKRYHEEQIWSDRIRRQSTWGTWGLMGVNVVLFLVLQFVAEPWRRKRLMRNIAENEKRVMEEVRRELEEVRSALEASGLRELRLPELARAGEVRHAASGEEELARESSVVSVADPEVAAPPVDIEEEPLPPRPWREILLDFWEDPELLREAVLDLTSDRRIALSMRDASLIALQSAAAGAAVAAVLAVSLLRST